MKKKLFGTWSIIDNADITEIFALSDYDFVIIDFEHGPHSVKNLSNHIRAGQIHKKKVFVRPSKLDKKEILRYLECDPNGIFVPDIRNSEEARHVVEACTYPPIGERGASGFTRSTKYGKENFLNHQKSKNKKIFICVLIESLEGLKNLESIIQKNPRIDCIYFGTFDLMSQMGLFKKKKINTLKFDQMLINKIKQIKKTNKKIMFGRVILDKDEFKRFKKFYDLFALRVDCSLIQEGIKQVKEKITN